MNRFLLPFLAACVLAGSRPALAPQEQAKTPLMLEMEKLDAALEALKLGIRDPTKDAASLEQIVLAQQACLNCKQMTPRMAPNVPEAERAKFLTDYRKGLAAALIELAKLETALLDGDRDQARALWRKIEQMEEEGHNTFTEGE